MTLEIIENFYDGAKEKIREVINNIKEHLRSLLNGILISIFSNVFIVTCHFIGLLKYSLKSPYAFGLSYPTVLLNLIFALIIPALLIVQKVRILNNLEELEEVQEKVRILNNLEELEEKFDMLNSMGNAISYVIGYFSVIVSARYIFPKYMYLFGITIGDIIIEVLFVVSILLFLYWLYEN